jgi:mutator family transposase
MTPRDVQTARLSEKLRRELGPVVLKALSDPDVIEIILNPDGRIWVESHTAGMSQTDAPMAPTQAENLIGTVAAALNAVANPQNPIIEGELPLTGSRFEGLLLPIAPSPCFVIRNARRSSTPRDRHGRFDPVLIGKYRRRFAGFDDKIIALYARGLTTREIAAHVGELYGVEISPDLVSAVTDAVLEEAAAWQSRALEATYAIVFFDAIGVKIRNEGMVNNRAVYLAIGVRCSGHKEILGLWIELTEGAKFWLRVMNELRNRGTQDILIAVVDGLKGFPEAIPSVFPQAVVQTCIVHLIRYSMHFASWRNGGR